VKNIPPPIASILVANSFVGFNAPKGASLPEINPVCPKSIPFISKGIPGEESQHKELSAKDRLQLIFEKRLAQIGKDDSMPFGTERNVVRRNDREGKNKLLVILQELLTAKATV